MRVEGINIGIVSQLEKGSTFMLSDTPPPPSSTAAPSGLFPSIRFPEEPTNLPAQELTLNGPFWTGSSKACQTITHATCSGTNPDHVCMRCDVSSSIQDTVESGSNVAVFFRNEETSFLALSVLHWAWNIQGRRFIYFSVDSSTSSVVLGLSKGTSFNLGDVDHGVAAQDSLALTFIHGRQDPGRDVTGRVGRLRFGKTGSPTRDYTVFTVNAFPTITPGDSYFYRQFMLTGQFVDTVEQATPLVDETEQVFRNENQHLAGSPVYICGVIGNTLEVGLESCSPEICTGSTRPYPSAHAFYHVSCGSSSYVGPDAYHFKPDSDFQRPYVCKDNTNDRPQWELLGYFDCQQFM